MYVGYFGACKTGVRCSTNSNTSWADKAYSTGGALCTIGYTTNVTSKNNSTMLYKFNVLYCNGSKYTVKQCLDKAKASVLSTYGSYGNVNNTRVRGCQAQHFVYK